MHINISQNYMRLHYTPNALIIVGEELLIHRRLYGRASITSKTQEIQYKIKENTYPHPPTPPRAGGGAVLSLILFGIFYIVEVIEALPFSLLWIRSSSPTIIRAFGVG